MEYAIIETGGKQYRVGNGAVLDVENLPAQKNGSVLFDKVLLYVNDSDVKIGNPLVANSVVKAKILESLRGDKVRVARFKAKSRYRKVRGHRQAITRIQIEKIENK